MYRKPLTILFVLFVFAVLAAAVRPAAAASCTAANGQSFIDAGEYKKAIAEFSCVISNDPTGVEGYRGRIEAELMDGKYSDAVRDYARLTAVVAPVHPDAHDVIFAGYAARLAANPDSITALTGESFAHWWYFEYAQGLQTLNHLLEIDPDNVYGNLFRGSSRLLHHAAKVKGAADLEYAILLDPNNPHLRYVVADAYTYGGLADPQRAFSEAMLAVNGGLDTPRLHAILGAAYNAFGSTQAAANEIKIHFDQVTTEYVTTAPIASGQSYSLDVVAGRTYVIPVTVAAGETVSIDTSSADYWDTIMVLLDGNGNPLVGSDDTNFYFAALDWVAPQAGTYYIQVTFFEGVIYGELDVVRH